MMPRGNQHKPLREWINMIHNDYNLQECTVSAHGSTPTIYYRLLEDEDE